MTGVTEVSARLLAKLRGLVESCDPEERALLAILLAPGFADVYGDEDDVRGFAMADGTGEPQGLAEALAAALERRRNDPPEG